VVFVVSKFQLVPAFAVFKIVPPLPTAYPMLSLKNRTDVNDSCAGLGVTLTHWANKFKPNNNVTKVKMVFFIMLFCYNLFLCKKTFGAVISKIFG
jgi:hypothetical protein